MSDTRKNLATGLAVNLATNQAYNLAGPGGVPDWRPGITAPQFSFRLKPDATNYTTVSGKVDTLTDTIPTANKAIAHAPYQLVAASAAVRPPVGPGLALVGNHTEYLKVDGDSDYDDIFGGTAAWALTCTAKMSGGSVHYLQSVHRSGGTDYLLTYGSGASATVANLRSAAGVSKSCGGGVTNNLLAVLTLVYNGTTLVSYLNGVYTGYTTPAVTQSMALIDGFSIMAGQFTGGVASPMQGLFYESLCQAAAIDAAEAALIAANMIADYS